MNPGKNGHQLGDNIFKCVSLNENFCILFQISLKFVPKNPIDLFHTNFVPSCKQPQHRKLAHEL